MKYSKYCSLGGLISALILCASCNQEKITLNKKSGKFPATKITITHNELYDNKRQVLMQYEVKEKLVREDSFVQTYSKLHLFSEMKYDDEDFVYRDIVLEDSCWESVKTENLNLFRIYENVICLVENSDQWIITETRTESYTQLTYYTKTHFLMSKLILIKGSDTTIYEPD